MTIITNGTVSITDGNKADQDYGQNRVVRVDITITGNEGEDVQSLLDSASTKAAAKVSELLGRKTHSVVSSKPTNPTQEAIHAVSPNETAPDKVKGKPGRKPKGDALPAVEGFPVEGETTRAGTEATNESIFDEPVIEVQKIDLSDKALYDMVVAINAKIKKPQEITAIVAKYCPNDGVPASMRRVPESKRMALIEEIKAFAASLAKK